ncbi:MAG: hypothetical protein ABH821_01115 [archaeon]
MAVPKRQVRKNPNFQELKSRYEFYDAVYKGHSTLPVRFKELVKTKCNSGVQKAYAVITLKALLAVYPKKIALAKANKIIELGGFDSMPKFSLRELDALREKHPRKVVQRLVDLAFIENYSIYRGLTARAIFVQNPKLVNYLCSLPTEKILKLLNKTDIELLSILKNAQIK